MKSIIRTKLIWDIDGTLLRTNGAAAIPFSKAVSDFAGVNVEIDRKYLSGFTDYEIAMHLLDSHNISFEMKNITQILNEYVRNLPQSLETIGVEIINTIDQVLEKLFQTPDIDLLIGTGNCLAGAKVKLEHVSLKKFFLDENIYYSSEIDWNRDLVIQKAKKSLSKNEIGIVIGDSPRDIKSAKKSGLSVIAVPTGAHSRDDLESNCPTSSLNKDWHYSDLMGAVEKIKELEAH
jgi:phosphoglycolate phosphatase-like HAD superfamily hydrolase